MNFKLLLHITAHHHYYPNYRHHYYYNYCFSFITSYVFLHTEHWASIRSYLPVVVSARPSWAPGVIGPLVSTVGTVEVVSALAMVTSLALPASSPQCGQKL